MPFKNRPPRQMNGMASMMQKARALPTVTAAAAASLVQPVAARLAGGTPSEREALDALNKLATRLAVAERQVSNVRKVIEAMTINAHKLPEGHAMRTLADQIMTTLLDAIAAAEKGGTVIAPAEDVQP